MVLEHSLSEIQDRYFILRVKLTLLIVLDSYRCNFSYQREHQLLREHRRNNGKNKVLKEKGNTEGTDLMQSTYVQIWKRSVCKAKLS